MEVEHTNIHPLTTLRPGAKPQSLEHTRPFGASEQAAPPKARTTDRAPAARPPAPKPATPATPATTNITLAAVDPDALSGGPGSNDPLTVDGLLEEWGERGSRYDLDGNGTVNMSDLLKLLADLGGNGNGAPDPKPVPEAGPVSTDETVTPPIGENDPQAEPPEPMTIAGLLEAWGEKGSRYDLDGNGTVNMTDLLEMLSRVADKSNALPDQDAGIGVVDSSNPLKKPVAPDPTLAANPGPPISDTIAEEQPSPQLTLKGLLDAWGERGSQYDLDGNGVVNMRDLLDLLAQLSPDPPHPGSNGAVVLTPPDITSRPGHETSSAQRVERLAESLRDRLEQRGFDKHPPTNIHQIVSRLQLAQDERKGLIEKLSDHYPQGLGVDFVG